MLISMAEYYGIQYLNDATINQGIFTQFPEFKEKWGDDVDLTMRFQFMPSVEDTFVIDTSKQGIFVDNNKLLVGADFLCSNSTHEQSRELSIAMFLEGTF